MDDAKSRLGYCGHQAPISHCLGLFNFIILTVVIKFLFIFCWFQLRLMTLFGSLFAHSYLVFLFNGFIFF